MPEEFLDGELILLIDAASRAGRLIHLEKGVLVPDDEMPRQAGH